MHRTRSTRSDRSTRHHLASPDPEQQARSSHSQPLTQAQLCSSRLRCNGRQNCSSCRKGKYRSNSIIERSEVVRVQRKGIPSIYAQPESFGDSEDKIRYPTAQPIRRVTSYSDISESTVVSSEAKSNGDSDGISQIQMGMAQTYINFGRSFQAPNVQRQNFPTYNNAQTEYLEVPANRPIHRQNSGRTRPTRATTTSGPPPVFPPIPPFRSPGRASAPPPGPPPEPRAQPNQPQPTQNQNGSVNRYTGVGFVQVNDGVKKNKDGTPKKTTETRAYKKGKAGGKKVPGILGWFTT